MTKLLPLYLFTLVLYGCGGSSSESNTDPGSGNQNQEGGNAEVFDFVGNNQQFHIEESVPVEVGLTGNGNAITVDADIQLLDILGNNNLITLAEGEVLENCEITGNDNTIEGQNIDVECNVVGNGNIIF